MMSSQEQDVSSNTQLGSMPPPSSTTSARSPLLHARSPASPASARRSPRIERRISNVPAYSLNDEPRSPHHNRAPSLGELHQELESEQEAAVNRLLTQIRREQQAQTTVDNSSTSNVPTTPASGNALSQVFARSRTPSLSSSRRPSSIQPPSAQATSHPAPPQPFRTPSTQSIPRPLSRTASPNLRPINFTAESPGPSPGAEWALPARDTVRDRDEVEFIKTETASVLRENRMLEARVRELERLLSAGGLEDGAGVLARGAVA